jgi:hypothetical protein
MKKKITGTSTNGSAIEVLADLADVATTRATLDAAGVTDLAEFDYIESDEASLANVFFRKGGGAGSSGAFNAEEDLQFLDDIKTGGSSTIIAKLGVEPGPSGKAESIGITTDISSFT